MERYINYKFFLFKLYPMRKFLLFVSFIVLSVSVFAQVPTITSFSPASAEVGASVTITGTNFDATAANNIVYFGSVKATVTAATTTSLSVTVPAGSTHSSISVNTNGLIALTKSFFRVTNVSISPRQITGSNFGNNIEFSSISGVNGDNIILAGDFNNDGKVDIVKAGSNNVRVHLNQMSNNGTISTSAFDAGTLFSVSGGARTIAINDLNGDGKLDIVTGSSSGISVLVNTTSGATLSFATSINISGNISSVRLADLNLDGKLDIAALNGGALSVYSNTTNGATVSFANAIQITLSTTGFNGLDLADMNLDGKYDIVVSKSGTTNILTNNSTQGSLSFSSPISLSVGHSYVAAVDLDIDGDNDLFLYNTVVNNGYSSGTLSSSNFTSYNNSHANDGDNLGLSVADFNGDGYPEVVSGTNWDKMWVYVNAASGSVSASIFSGKWYPRQNLYCGSCGPGIGVDINGDNKVDAVSSYRDQSSFVITQNLMAPAPSITVSGTLTSFTTCLGTNSSTQTLTVSGSDLTANITATAPAGYEISLVSGTGFASSITLTRSGTTVAATTIYVRLQGTASNNPSGNIAFTSTGATTRNVAVSGSVGTNNVFIGALSFDGVNDKVTIADNNALDLTNNYTMEAWIYPRAFPWLGGIISKYHSNSSNGYHLRLSPNGNSSGLSFDEMNTANNILTLNTWHHVAAVNNNGTRKLYVNGVEVALTGTPTTVVANSDPLIIGRDFDGGNAGRFFNGDIDEVRLWNFAKTEAQVVAQKDISLTGSESNLVLYYNFNQGTPGGNNTSITTVSNLATGSHTGTLNGFDRTSTSSNFVTSTNAPVIGGSSSLCLGTPLELTHSVSGGTWSIPATTGLAISNSGVLTGTTSTTATSVVVSYLYTYNGCEYTDTKSISIGQLTVGTASGNQTLCSSAAASAITLAGNTSGSTIQWQSSPDNATFSNISNATAASLSPGSLTSTTYFRAAVTSAACGTLYSNVITKGYNNSLSFDGTDDYVEAGAPLPIAANDNFTYEAWVRPSVIDANYRGFFGTSVLNVGRAPSMWVGPNGSLHTDSYNGSTRYDMLVNNFFTANTWVHVAWVKNGTTYTIYRNGVEVDTRTAPSSVLLPNANFTIGKLDNFFAGTLDEVRIWNTARTAQEITDNMSATLNGNETGLRAYYTFNQGTPDGTNTSITTVANLTATANLNGTLTGFAKTGTTSNFVGGFRAVIASQPVAPTAVCLNASSNTISVTAYGSGITYQWYTNTANSTTGATAITNATTNSYEVPTNVAGTKFYYVVVTGACSSAITSNIVSQVINSSTFSTEPSSAAQNIAFGGTATALTVASSGATAYQWYSTPTKPSLVSGFSGGTGWTSSTGSFQTFALFSGGNPAIDSDGYLRFAYTSPSSIYRDFTLDQAATTISFSAQYASLDNNNDRGKIQLYFYNVSNTQVGSVSQSADLTGSNTWQSTALTNVAIPAGATKVRVIFYQIQEYPYWAGNYGIAFRNPSVTTNVALNGTAITGATSATYTPSTSTPGALYFYAVATGGCSTATSALSGLITVGKATPTIASMAAINKTFGDAAFTLTAPTSNATGAFTFTSSNIAVATISGTTVTIVGAGTATITATQATDANYNAGSVTALLTVAKGIPVIAFMADINKTFGNAPFSITAPASNSTGAFSYTSSTTSVATIAGSLVSITGAGSTTITVSQAASANYNAGSITTLLLVAKANPTIGTQSNITRGYGSAAVTLVAPSSNSTGAFTYSISDAAVATISGATLTAAGIGTATITATQAATANYNAGSVTRTITVVKGMPTLGTFAAINKTFGDAAFTLTAPTSLSTGAFTYASDNTAVATVSGATVTIVGAGTANITATQATDANYNPASVTAVLTVAKATPTLSSFADINKTTTDAPFAIVAPTSSAGTGAITYASSNAAVATVSGSNVTITGIGTSIITATQAADANYLAATISATLTVILGDSDGDGVPDDVEIRDGTDPNNPSSVKDSDGDGVPDYVEIGSGTNPNSPADAIDSDGDGLSDYYEARNAAPTNIALSATTINENNTAGAAIVDITATDVNIGETFTYALVAGTGDADNASFTINGSSLRAVNAFDFETRTTYSLRLKVTDKGGLSFEKEFVITIADVNDAPTNISLSANAVAENAASGTTVGTLAGTDADAAETFTYTLVSGTGDTDNASFTITGSTLRTAAVFDFETKNSYSVRVRVTDAGGLTFEKVFTISVTDINEAPTALALSNASVLENAASGTTVGTLAGTDADAGDTHTYTLVSGTGSTDNASFTITGTTLSTAAVFNFEAKNSYAVRVRVTDAGGLTFERAFTISVTDVNEAPTLTAITDRRVYNVSTSQVVNLAGITAGPETAQSTTTTVSTDKPATFSSINVVGTQIQFTLAAGIVTPQDVVVTVRVKDNGGVANGGVDTLVRTFKLGIDPMPVAAASPNLITLGATAQLSAAGANAINYTWVAVGGSGIVGSGATINVRPKGTTTYAVVVTNSFGYQATVPVLLTVIVDYKLVPNNLVTPNGDGVNDKWVIPNIDMYPDNEVMVYDKAGRAVFAKRGYNNEWDGTVNGKLLKEDAYFYVIKFNKDGALPIRGYVSIVR
jgi:gliding motility-associated-like protein